MKDKLMRKRKPKPSPPVDLPPRVHRKHEQDEKMLAVGRRGALIGESCPWCIYSDWEVDCAMTLREAGWSYRAIAEKLDMPRSTVHAICTGQRRAAIPVRYKRRK